MLDMHIGTMKQVDVPFDIAGKPITCPAEDCDCSWLSFIGAEWQESGDLVLRFDCQWNHVIGVVISEYKGQTAGMVYVGSGDYR